MSGGGGKAQGRGARGRCNFDGDKGGGRGESWNEGNQHRSGGSGWDGGWGGGQAAWGPESHAQEGGWNTWQPFGGGEHQGGGKGGQGGRSAPLSALEDLMRRKGVDEAWTALEEMQRQGLFVDRFTVSRMLMKTVAEGRAHWDPQKVYRGIGLVEAFMQLQPEEADEVLFNALLDTCCRMKDLPRLETTMLKMRELQIYPSHVTLGILVKAYGQAGDISKVLKVWQDMDEQRRQANAVTYGCMIDACVKCGHVAKAVEIFEDMKSRRKHRNTILYTTLIKGYGMEKDCKNALELFREMRTEGVPYNTITYNSIIDVCIKSNEVATAEDLLREMMQAGSNLEPDLITYSTVLKGYCHSGDLDKALQVAETIKACGLQCDELVYNTLMDGCVKANDLSAGIGLFAEMTQSGMMPSTITHSILVRLYQRSGFKGDSYDAVAQLYQHHGLERPVGIQERGGGSKNGRKAGGRQQDRQHQGHRGSAPPPLRPGQVAPGGGSRGGGGGGGDRHQPQLATNPSGPPGAHYADHMDPPPHGAYGDEFGGLSGRGGCLGSSSPVLGTNVPGPSPYPCTSSVPCYAGAMPFGRGGPPSMQGPGGHHMPYPGSHELLHGLYRDHGDVGVPGSSTSWGPGQGFGAGFRQGMPPYGYGGCPLPPPYGCGGYEHGPPPSHLQGSRRGSFSSGSGGHQPPPMHCGGGGPWDVPSETHPRYADAEYAPAPSHTPPMRWPGSGKGGGYVERPPPPPHPGAAALWDGYLGDRSLESYSDHQGLLGPGGSGGGLDSEQ